MGHWLFFQPAQRLLDRQVPHSKSQNPESQSPWPDTNADITVL